MADEEGRPNPGAFGVDHLTSLVQQMQREMKAGFHRLERMVSNVATRAEFDQAKAMLAQAIADAATRVTTDLQALRDQLAAGNPITDQDLADIQGDVTALGALDAAVVPPPTP